MGNLGRRITMQELRVLIAYAVFLALVGFLLWGDYLSAFGDLRRGAPPAVLDLLARILPLPVTLLVCGRLAWHRGRQRVHDRRGLVTRCLVVLCLFEVAGLLLLIAAASGAYGPVSQVLVPLFLGCAGALSFVLFQNSLAKMPLRSAGFVVIGAAAASAPLYFVAMLLPPATRTVVSFVVLAPAYLLLLLSFDLSAHEGEPMRPVSKSTAEQLRTSLAQPLVNISLSAVVVGILNTVPSSTEALAVTNNIKMAGLAVSGVALYFVWERYGERMSFDVLYRWAFPLVAAAYLLLPALYSSYAFLLIGFSYMVFSIASALMVLTCLRAAHEQSVNEIAVYGVFAGIVYLCLSLGSVIGSAVVSTSWNGVPVLLVVALVAVYALAMFDRRIKAPAVEAGTSLEGSGGDAGADSASTHEPAPETTGGNLNDRCANLGESLGLSPRETEVLALLAHGRDVPTVARMLGVSENTVRTHTKNIYTKAGVHTKQELLDLLERQQGA